jgi:hypothetical protein
MNNNKTAIYFSSNTSEVDKVNIQRSAGIPTIQRYDTYLGLLAFVGCSRMAAFKGITE